jgi:hypothetical protein
MPIVGVLRERELTVKRTTTLIRERRDTIKGTFTLIREFESDGESVENGNKDFRVRSTCALSSEWGKTVFFCCN